MSRSKSLDQAYQAQDAAYHVLMRYIDQVAKADEVRPTDATAISTLISALDRAQDRVRIHRRVPLPGVARPQALGKGRSKSGGRDVSAFLASLAPQQQGTSSAPDQASGDAHDPAPGGAETHGSDEPTGDQEQSSPDPAAEQPDPDQAGPAGT